MQAGGYYIRPGTTAEALMDLFVQGKVLQHSFTLVEGWTFRQLRQAMHSHPELVNTLTDLSDQEVMARIGHPDEHPEGRFLPESYLFPDGTEDVFLGTETAVPKIHITTPEKTPGKGWNFSNAFRKSHVLGLVS